MNMDLDAATKEAPTLTLDRSDQYPGGIAVRCGESEKDRRFL